MLGLLPAKGPGSSANSSGNSRKTANYFEIGCSFLGWSSPYDCSCRGKAPCQKQYLPYHSLTALSSAFNLCSLSNIDTGTDCNRKLQVFQYRSFLDLTVMFQMTSRNAMKSSSSWRSIHLQDSVECILLFTVTRLQALEYELCKASCIIVCFHKGRRVCEETKMQTREPGATQKTSQDIF